MRLLVTILIIILFNIKAFAQEPKTHYFDRDQLGLELLSNQWLEIPDHIKLNPRSLAFNIQLMYNILGRNSNVALAAGLGFLTENYEMDATPKKSNSQLIFAEIDPNLKYKANKIRFTTVEIPLEIRIRNNRNSRNKIWKMYVGGKVGYLFRSMHKYNGDNPQNPDEKLKQKTFNIPYTEPFSYGATARIGYGQFMISGYYALTNRFQKNKAPDLFPIMIGITYFVY